VQAVITLGGSRIGLDGIEEGEFGGTCGQVGEMANGGSSKDRCANGRGMFAGTLQPANWDVQDIGQDLAPEVAFTATTDQMQVVDHKAIVAMHGDCVAQGHGNAFENGAQEVGCLVFRGQADKGTTGIGIEMGRPFAGQVRQEDQAVRAGATEAASSSNWRKSGTWQAAWAQSMARPAFWIVPKEPTE